MIPLIVMSVITGVGLVVFIKTLVDDYYTSYERDCGASYILTKKSNRSKTSHHGKHQDP